MYLLLICIMSKYSYVELLIETFRRIYFKTLIITVDLENIVCKYLICFSPIIFIKLKFYDADLTVHLEFQHHTYHYYMQVFALNKCYFWENLLKIAHFPFLSLHSPLNEK